MSSFLKGIWDVVGSEVGSAVTGLLGTEQDEQNRQEKVTNLLIDRPFEFGKKIGLFDDKIEAPPVINNFDPNASTTENFKTSLMDMSANAGQDSEIFRKNLPASLFEIGEFGIDLAMNPIKYGKEAINLTSGFATMPFENIDNANNEEMARMVYDSTKEFLQTEGALRKAALENPADVLALMFGGAAGIKRLQALKPETKERMLTTIKKIGATPVGLSLDVDYGGSHRPPGRNGGAPGHDVTTGSEGGVFPEDVYGADAKRLYGVGGETFNNDAAIHTIKVMRNNPDSEVTIYRAVPPDVENPEINPGDWVTTVERYAEDHAMDGYGVRGDLPGKVIKKTVKAKDIFTNGDSIFEWGYHPAKPTPARDNIGGYSKLEKTVIDMKQDSMPKEQVESFFANRAISNDEMSDLGILAYLDELPEKSKVTKEGLLGIIADNRIELQGQSLETYTDNAFTTTTLGNTELAITDQISFHPGAYDTDMVDGVLTANTTPDYYTNLETPDGTYVSMLEQESGDRELEIENMMSDFNGSFEKQIERSDSYERRQGKTTHRELYPFNMKRDAKRIANKRHYDLFDYNQAEVMEQMHIANPDRYPETIGIKLKRAMDVALDQGVVGDNLTELYASLPDRNELRVRAKDTEELQAMLFAQAEDNKRLGIKEWDQDFLEKYADPDQDFGNSLISDEFDLDFQTAIDKLVEVEYLKEPVILQDVPIEHQGETLYYKIYGAGPTNGFEVYNTDGQHMGTQGDMPSVQALINDDAVNRGYIDDPDALDFDEQSTRYSGYVSNEMKAHMDTYSEELIQLQSRPGEIEFDGAHFDNNTIAHLRKTIRGGENFPNTIVGLDDVNGVNPEVFKVDEFQSDWHSEGRQYGYTDEEKALKQEIHDEDVSNYVYLTEQRTRLSDEINVDGEYEADIDDVRDIYEDIGEDSLQLIEAHKLKHYDMDVIFYDAEGRPFAVNQANMTEEQFDEAWLTSKNNPESDTFQPDRNFIFMMTDYLNGLDNELDQFGRKLKQHTPMPRNPMKGDKIYMTGLTHAINKAIEGGQRYVAWSSSDEVMQMWNAEGRTNSKGNLQFQELYTNIYDKKLPKAASKILKRYGGGKIKTIKIDGTVNQVIEITDEMIENFRKEFPDLEKNAPLPFSIYGKAGNIPSGLLKTDITEQQGLIA